MKERWRRALNALQRNGAPTLGPGGDPRLGLHPFRRPGREQKCWERALELRRAGTLPAALAMCSGFLVSHIHGDTVTHHILRFSF